MEAVAARALAHTWSESIVAAALAAASALAVVALAPPGGDTAAHLYRTELVRDGVTLWDNLWFAGHYPLASYSLLYYLPAALVGNVPLVVAGVVASAALFAALATHEWGAAARWSARAFGVAAAGPLYTGTYSYALGLAAALAALRLLQLGRPALAVAGAAISLAFSPLAFAFLSLALAAATIVRRPPRRSVGVLLLALAAVAAAQLAVMAAFPSAGRYPFSPVSLGSTLGVSALAAALALRAERARLLAVFFVLWAAVNLAAFLVPSPFGDNLTRLRALVFPLVLLVAVLVEFRPRWLAAAALAAALAYNVAPDLSALPKRAGDVRTAEQAYWAPALDFVLPRAGAEFRVTVVPTFGHWEAYWVPRSGLALARGWYRQIDMAENPELYRRVEPQTYRRWLRRLGVRYVLVPSARLGALRADEEAELLRSRRSGLARVYDEGEWSIYELRGATPILTGPAAAKLTQLEHDLVAGSVSAPGRYRLRIRHTAYWDVRGDVCIARAADGMTTLVAKRATRFELRAALRGRRARC